MTKFLVAVSSLLMLTGVSFGDSIPLHFHNSCKVTALEQMVQWMKGTEFYSITKIDDREGKISSGQDALFLRVSFDDAKGCLNRQMMADCIILDANTIFAQLVLTQCKAKPLTTSREIK